MRRSRRRGDGKGVRLSTDGRESGIDPRLRTIGALITGRLEAASLDPREAAELARLAGWHGVAPMLQDALQRRGIDPAEEPDGPWGALLPRTRQSAVRYLLLRSAQAEIRRTLEAHGLRELWLKGFALAHTVYPDPTFRPMADLDVWLPEVSRTEALRLLGDLGYRPPYPRLFDRAPEFSYHDFLHGGPGGEVTVELHRHLLGGPGQLLDGEDLQWFLDGPESFDDGDVAFLTLRREAHFLYLLAHALLQHGESESPLRWYLDLDLLIRSGLDWDLIVDRALDLGWVAALERVLFLCRAYFDSPIPSETNARIRELPRSNDRRFLLDQGRREESPFRYVRKQMATLRPGHRLEFVFRILFPRTEYMRWRYGVRRGWLLPLVYPYRWAALAGKALRGIVAGRRTESGTRPPPRPQG